MADRAKELVTSLLAQADVRIGGERPWDIEVKDERWFGRVLAHGSLGAGESWMDGWWQCPALDQFLERIFLSQVQGRLRISWRVAPQLLWQRLINPQSRRRSFTVGERHYDVGNDLFRRMLDRRMVYSCGYWKDADNLDQAQENKLELICRKLDLQPGQRLLDIGCGWGSLARFAAERFGVEVIGVTISREQARLAREHCADLPVEIRLSDYRDLGNNRDLDQPFDHIASVGMVEHVGSKNYRTYMEVAARCLKPGGLFLLHTIGSNHSVHRTDPWIGKYIFPNSQLPSLAQLSRASEGLMLIEDLHSFGPDYDRTLMAWHENFTRHWPEIAERYGERFRRMWTFYLLCCAASFRVRRQQLWQLVLARLPRPRPVATVRDSRSSGHHLHCPGAQPPGRSHQPVVAPQAAASGSGTG